ncbi:MAG: hypothetical protein AAFY12_12455 [Pseudomonadota bacterium]
MGKRTDSYGSVSLIDDLIGHVDTGGQKSLNVIPVSQLATQLEASRGTDYATLAELQADLSWIAGALARVWGDPVLANRGVYQKSGAVGEGAWTRIGPLPETDLSHSLRVPTGEFINPFPDAATRAGTVVMFDGAGQPISGPDASDIANAQSNAEQAALDRLAAVQAKDDAVQAKDDAEQAAIDAQNTVLGNALSIDFTPSGTVVSDNVQDAIEELDADIQSKADASAIGAELPIGSTMLWMSDAAPSALWVVVKSNDQVFSRSTFHVLFDHYAPERTVVITNGSAVVTGIGSDQALAPGMDVEGAEIPVGTTILSVDGPSQVTLSAAATANGTTCRVFRYGNGDGSMTCNFPPFAGRYFRFGDPSSAINPDAAGAMGVTMLDALQDHVHPERANSNGTGSLPSGTSLDTGHPLGASGHRITSGNSSVFSNFQVVTDGPSTPIGARVSSETRPKTIIGYVAVKVADGVDDPELLAAAGVIQDLTDVISKADANETKIKTIAILEYRLPSGSDGGDVSGGVWETIPLNTIAHDPQGIVDLTANEFTASQDCEVQFCGCFYGTNRARARLWNVTDGVEASISLSTFSNSTAEAGLQSHGVSLITGNKTYRLESFCQSGRAINGRGTDTSTGSDEVFAYVILRAI